MRSTKVIDPSLKKKINENDEKMKMLYGIEFKRSKSKKGTFSAAKNKVKNRNKKNNDDSYSEMMIKTYKDNTPITTDSKFSKTINTDRDDSSAFMSRMQKRMKFKRDKEEKKNNTIFYNTFTNVYKRMEDKKKKKTMNKDEVDNMVDRLYNNDYKHRKPRVRESEEKKNKTIDLEDEPDVDEMIERFEEDIKKREENMEIIKRKIARDEKEIYTYKPKMSEGSKKYNDQNETDFFERQKNFLEKKAEKEKSMKETLKKKQEDEINENNILKKKEEEKKEKKVDDSEKKAKVEKSIKKMYEWEEKRKQKIEQKKKENSEKVETDYDYIPKINERSAQLAENNKLRQKQPNIFLRLSEEDKVLKEKKQILTDMYTPSFKPRSYVPRNMNLEHLKRKNYMSQNEVEEGEEEDEENERKKRKRRKKHKKRNEDSDEEDEDEDEEDEDEDEEGEEEEDDEEEEEKGEEDDFDYKQDTMKYADDNVQDALRNQLFHRKKK